MGCWHPCGDQGGACDWCGKNGYCCSGDSSKLHLNGDCGDAQMDPIVQYYESSGWSGHACAIGRTSVVKNEYIFEYISV